MAEQSHGGLRHGLKDGVSYESTDAARAYLTNEEYHNRGLRRNGIRERELKKRKRDGDNDNTAKPRTKSAVKHDKCKTEQQLIGVQLLASGAKYERTRLNGLPEDVKKQTTIRCIMAKGLLYKNKRVEILQADRAAEKLARRRTIPHSLEEWKITAASKDVENDSMWKDPEIIQLEQDLDSLSSKGFWSKLTLKDGFKSQVERVLPGFWESSMADQPKKQLMLGIAKYLEKVCAIADKKLTTRSQKSTFRDSLEPRSWLNLLKWTRLQVYLIIEQQRSSGTR